MKILRILSGMTLAMLVSGAALAQGPAAPAAPAPPGQPEVKSFGDWSVRCFPVQSASPCDMFQEQDDTQSKQRMLALSIAYDPHVDRHVMQIAVPLGVAVPPGVIVHTDKYSSPALPYRRCDRGGCYVELLTDGAMIDQLSHGGDGAVVKITADDGKKYDIKISLNGFSAAHDSMVELARQKAKAPAAPAAAPAK
jgi:invasion protein IalB